MNPNDPNKVDPKLMQAYESIMAGNPQPQGQNPSPQQAQTPQPQPAPMMQTEQIVEQPLPQTPPLLQNQEVLQSPLSKGGEAFVNPNPSAQDAQEAINPKKKNKLLPIFLIVGGLLFFLVYGVIWSKVFGLF